MAALSAACGLVNSASVSPWWFGRFGVLALGVAASWAIQLFAALWRGPHQEKAIPPNDQPSQTAINKIIVGLGGDDLQMRHKAKKRWRKLAWRHCQDYKQERVKARLDQ